MHHWDAAHGSAAELGGVAAASNDRSEDVLLPLLVVLLNDDEVCVERSDANASVKLSVAGITVVFTIVTPTKKSRTSLLEW